MYAIINTDGRQYKVAQGDIVLFDKRGLEPKAAVTFEKVLLVSNDGALTVGSPFIEGAKVTGEAINEGRGKKIIIFKKRRRKDSKQKRGFRRDFTRVRITGISL
ncbi:MAG: 50S ribosomal protein L21 [Helicobacteraceae bacterium]|jgi:large subunit ribosomal protein L21|nr:50S ribosomal protein L21 [Helicobacteraceae bacterium]